MSDGPSHANATCPSGSECWNSPCCAGTIRDLRRERERLLSVANAAMVMYAACPADPDATLRYECAVDGFVDALAKADLRLPAPKRGAGSSGNDSPPRLPSGG